MFRKLSFDPILAGIWAAAVVLAGLARLAGWQWLMIPLALLVVAVPLLLAYRVAQDDRKRRERKRRQAE